MRNEKEIREYLAELIDQRTKAEKRLIQTCENGEENNLAYWYKNVVEDSRRINVIKWVLGESETTYGE